MEERLFIDTYTVKAQTQTSREAKDSGIRVWLYAHHENQFIKIGASVVGAKPKRHHPRPIA